MNTQLIGLLAETSIHPGAGQSAGVVDLPVAREAATDYPVIPGSSLKGALRSLAEEAKFDSVKRIFGESDNAGALLVSDARLLLLPVRSLQSAYKWITCSHLLERFQRDLQRASQSSTPFKIPVIEPGRYYGKDDDQLFLEERQFKPQQPLPEGLLENIGQLIGNNDTRKRMSDQLVILHDDDFSWFARYGLAVQARNELKGNKTSNNLWYEETIPADSLFYTILAERGADALAPVTSLFAARPYLQVGGNETVGMGWFAVSQAKEKGDAQ